MSPRRPEKLDAHKTANALLGFFQFLKLLLPVRRGRGLTMRTRPSHHCCHPRLPSTLRSTAMEDGQAGSPAAAGWGR
jgi:hypothetical protein